MMVWSVLRRAPGGAPCRAAVLGTQERGGSRGRSVSGRFLAVALVLSSCGGGNSTPAASTPPSPIDLAQPWVSAVPGDVGLDPLLLGRATENAAAIPRFRSLLVVRHGKLVVERYFGGATPETRFDVRSVTKSVVSLLVGQVLEATKISGTDATVGDYVGPPYVLDPGDRAVTIKELLTMTSGYQWNEEQGDDYNLWIVSPDHVQFLLDRAQTGPPGPFTYNSAAVHLLGLVVQLATGTPLASLADQRLFQPIGIRSAIWEELERGTVNGGSGLQLTGQDLARLGQLMVQQGRSGSQQVVPAGWIGTATTPQFPWRDTVGAQRSVTYGYLWWVADPPSTQAFFAWGYGGQFVYVVPSLDLVIVTTTEWRGLSADNLTPRGIAAAVLGVIVNDIVPAALPH
jgi:CubicO group peptidase (beta-lactamase class C family)